MEQLKRSSLILLLGLGLLAGAFFLGRHTAPAKVEYRTQTVVKEVEKKDVRTVVRTIRKKDGTIEKTRITEDKSKKNVDSSTNNKQVITSKKPDWRVSGLVGLKNSQPVYGGSVERRILGNIFLGVWSVPGNVTGASVGFEF